MADYSLNVSASSQFAATQVVGTFDIGGSDPFTIECLVKLSAPPTSIGWIVTFASDASQGAANWDKALRVGSVGEVDGYVWDGSEVIATATTKINDGQAHHLALTFDGSTLTIYVDGKAEGTATPSSTFSYGGQAAIVVNKAGFIGLVDELRVWSVCRSAQDIDAYRNVELNGTEPGLIGYWKFSEGTGTSASDSTANNNGVTLYSGAGWGESLLGGQRIVVPQMALDVALGVPHYDPVQSRPPTLDVSIQALPVITDPFAIRVGTLDAQLQVHAPAPRIEMFPGLLDVQGVLYVPGWDRGTFIQPVSCSIALHPPAGRVVIPEEIPQAPFYQLVLTGAADGKPDAVLPMSSFEARARSGEPTYLRATIPWTTELAQAVTERPNGELVVYRGLRSHDGLEVVDEILRVNLEDIRIDRGGRSASITLVGHKQTTNPNPVGIELSGTIYRREINGLRAYRVAASNWLRPGDTVTLTDVGETLTVGVVSWIVGRNQEIVEIQEAA